MWMTLRDRRSFVETQNFASLQTNLYFCLNHAFFPVPLPWNHLVRYPLSTMFQKKPFHLVSEFKPMGDQPAAIENLVKGLNKGVKHQTLLGATGTGKTFAMANIVQQVQRPTLVLAHNKTLAAQLCSEF